VENGESGGKKRSPCRQKEGAGGKNPEVLTKKKSGLTKYGKGPKVARGRPAQKTKVKITGVTDFPTNHSVTTHSKTRSKYEQEGHRSPSGGKRKKLSKTRQFCLQGQRHRKRHSNGQPRVRTFRTGTITWGKISRGRPKKGQGGADSAGRGIPLQASTIRENKIKLKMMNTGGTGRGKY